MMVIWHDHGNDSDDDCEDDNGCLFPQRYRGHCVVSRDAHGLAGPCDDCAHPPLLARGNDTGEISSAGDVLSPSSRSWNGGW